MEKVQWKISLYTPTALPASFCEGGALTKRVKKTKAAQRAPLAARIARGDVSIVALTTAQVAVLTGLSVNAVRLAKGASDEDLAALRSGAVSLNTLRAKRAKPRPKALDRRAAIQAAFAEINAEIADLGLEIHRLELAELAKSAPAVTHEAVAAE